MTGFAGDTLASALVANGVKLVGRSFKYHRPRGILTAGSEEPNALVELRSGARREPNTRATTAELYDGLTAASQNRWPSLRHDLLSVNQLASPIFVAGFYYKTFMWPAKFWEAIYEPLIRRAAGLGRAASVPDPDHYEKAWAYCDVLIAGGGPTGLAAALAAGRAGARVILCEEDNRLGGRLLSDGGEIDGMPASDWIARTLAELQAMPDVRIMTRTTVTGVYDGGTYAALERVNDHLPVPPAHQPRQRLWRIVAKRSIVAAGALERPIVFAGNDVPGVMMASAMRSYIARYAAAPAKRIALFTNNDSGWKTVEAALRAGLSVAAVVDARPDVAAAHRELAAKSGFAILNGSVDAVSGGKDGIDKISVALAGGARATIEAEGLGGFGRLESVRRTDLISSRPAEMARRYRGLRARRSAARHDGGRRGERRIRARRLPCRGPCGGRSGGRRSWLWRRRRRCSLGRSRGEETTDAALACRRQRKGFRRLPERRDRVGHQTGGARRF